MPCYEIRTASVLFKVENIELLKKALEKEWHVEQGGREDFLIATKKNTWGEKITIDLKVGKIQSRIYSEKDLPAVSNSIKRAYSLEVINELARKQKWIKKEMGQDRIQLQRF